MTYFDIMQRNVLVEIGLPARALTDVIYLKVQPGLYRAIPVLNLLDIRAAF